MLSCSLRVLCYRWRTRVGKEQRMTGPFCSVFTEYPLVELSTATTSHYEHRRTMSKAKREAKREFEKQQELAKLQAKQQAKDQRKLDNAKRAADERARRAALTPDERARENKVMLGCGGAVAVVVLALLGIGSCSAREDGDSETPNTPLSSDTLDAPKNRVVPDLVGKPANQARRLSLAEGLAAVTTDCTGRDRGVWNESNWFVISQDPLPGTEVADGAEIWLCVEKYSN